MVFSQVMMASSGNEPMRMRKGMMIEDVARLTRLLGFSDQVGMPGSEGRRPHRGLSPEEQLSSQAVMAPLPAEIPWPLGIAARRSALPPPRDSTSLGAASRGVSLRQWDGRCQAGDPGSLVGDTGPASRTPAERAFGTSTSEPPSGITAAFPSPPLPIEALRPLSRTPGWRPEAWGLRTEWDGQGESTEGRTMGSQRCAATPFPPLSSYLASHIPPRRPPPSPPCGASLGQSMSGWPSGVAVDSGMSVGEIAPTWSGRLDAAPHHLDDHVRYFHTDPAGTPANYVSNSDVSNSRWGDEGTVAPQRPAPSPSREDRGNGKKVRTVVIRNLPPGLDQKRLLSELDENGFHNTYSVLHMPANLSTSQSKGFAFVHFFAEEQALRLMTAWNGTHRFGGQVPLNLAPSRKQGSLHMIQSKRRRIGDPAFRPLVASVA